MAGQDALRVVTDSVDARRSFVLEAGAGSGKTYALVHALRHILATQADDLRRSGKRVACITYTNVAKNEIIDRVAGDDLIFVQTIHEFLWHLMRQYQGELRSELVMLNAASRRPIDDLEELLGSKDIFYSDRGRKFEDGRVSHDEIIKLAGRLFETFPKAARIARDMFPIIFVDEYQDTQEEVVNLLLGEYLVQGVSIVGFFGDSMQKIYQSGVGSIADDRLTVIPKVENFRCSHKVIGVLNAMRPELQQVAAGDTREGNVHVFCPSERLSDDPVASTLSSLVSYGWTRENTKVLMLTHKSIAGSLSYDSLLSAYGELGSFGREQLIARDEPLIKFLSGVDTALRAWESRNFAKLREVLGRDSGTIKRHEDKKRVAQDLGSLMELKVAGTVGEVIQHIDERGLMDKPRGLIALQKLSGMALDELDDSQARRRSFFEKIQSVPYAEVTAFLDFVETRTPLSTQHGVKGAEFENVLVVIDDKAWTLYNIDKMLARKDTSAARIERSRNLFYVCCSRAISGLGVVFVEPPSGESMNRLTEWFGTEAMKSVPMG